MHRCETQGCAPRDTFYAKAWENATPDSFQVDDFLSLTPVRVHDPRLILRNKMLKSARAFVLPANDKSTAFLLGEMAKINRLMRIQSI